MTDDAIEKIMADVVSHAAFTSYDADQTLTLEDGYRFQDALADRLVARGGRIGTAGWKIAANAPQLLERFGLEEPLSGRVFKSQVHESPANLSDTTFRQFAFEPEIAAIMKTGLSGTNISRQETASAIDRLVPAIELLDMREVDMPSVRIANVVAQNISNEGIVIGGPGIAPQDFDPDVVQTEVSVDGKVELQVTGAAPQNPIDAVAWLADHLTKRGQRLEAGQVVLCGTHCPIWYHDKPGDIVVEMTDLGEVAMRL
ncbi:2-keto-4-pentenoate hydratase [Hoeflea prorocentri]|uniref:Fumarylacetoacetate hydrolase family protein n=1 Tax=Hoeflea prorocentri TaxID=1922333 RepID=A0A9X3ULR9_9HYPH|nr:fumarylacetoacetate hydrolase family protein [Hoeflea prorocentri]MCY6382942.1 fumarylacetoacetate hydrolase family protein [Hoeflea prorocentri]MDA5400742.1 fumarylacetoacetate hydrolase family protein [Hoeflea prorocentri]